MELTPAFPTFFTSRSSATGETLEFDVEVGVKMEVPFEVPDHDPSEGVTAILLRQDGRTKNARLEVMDFTGGKYAVQFVAHAEGDYLLRIYAGGDELNRSVRLPLLRLSGVCACVCVCVCVCV